VKEELTTTSARAGRNIAEESEVPISPAKARRKFEAPKDAQAASGGDLAESLGGAKSTEPGGMGSKSPEPDAGDESATSRLLRAKKRAHDQRDEP